jgi:hypothetical protein
MEMDTQDVAFQMRELQDVVFLLDAMELHGYDAASSIQ